MPNAPLGQLYVNDVKINICKNCSCYIDVIVSLIFVLSLPLPSLSIFIVHFKCVMQTIIYK